jgi:hypothetical protein
MAGSSRQRVRAEKQTMTIEEIKQAKDVRPFQSFLIHLADGRELSVTHPDGIAWNPGSRRIVVCGVPSGWEIIDTSLIVSLSVREEQSA